MIIQPKMQFSAQELAQINQLVERGNAAEKIDLKINPEMLAHRSGTTVEDWLVLDYDRIVGLLSLFVFGTDIAEISGMIDPVYRRQSLFSTLAEQAVAACKERGIKRILWIIPDDVPSGTAWIATRPAPYSTAEYSMLLHTPPAVAALPPAITLRPTTHTDLPWMVELMSAGFDSSPESAAQWISKSFDSPQRSYLAVTHQHQPIGTLGIQRDYASRKAYIFGFVIQEHWRGKGIGGAVLRHVARKLHDEGRTPIELEVEITNAQALGLYTRSGFKATNIYKYYAEQLV